MDTVKKFLVGAIGLVVTLVIVGTGIGIYRSTKPIADFATEGVNTLAGEMTSPYYKYNGKVMTGKEIKDAKTSGGLKDATLDGDSDWNTDANANVSYTLTVNWNSNTNTLENITITKLNK